MKQKIICTACNKIGLHQGKGLCRYCYRKKFWGKIIICNVCKRERKHHAFGLCNPCHSKKHHYHQIKRHNVRKWHNIDLETYERVTKFCIICGFNTIVELHHIDEDHKNNNETNLMGLCPNHHKMRHHSKYKEEIKQKVQMYLQLKKVKSPLDEW